MTNAEILHRRLINQQLGFTKLRDPVQIISWLAAMQAQEYQMAKWAIGLRLSSCNNGVHVLKDRDIEKLFNDGRILRTHLLRPTWHFVRDEDIRWLLLLTAPRVRQANAFMNRKMGLDEGIFKKSNQIIINELSGGRYMTRTGNQFTYALLEERVPPTTLIDSDEALLELTRRYLASRGPACLQDYVTWSGLTATLCKKGIGLLDKKLVKKIIERKEYFFFDSGEELVSWKKIQKTFLMADYDEYGMSYKYRSAFFQPSTVDTTLKSGIPVYNRMFVIDGKIRGSWKRSILKGVTVVETIPFSSLNARESKDLQKAVNNYRSFLDLSG